MARLTKQERATLADLSKRAKEEDDADAGYSLTVETANGHKVKLTGAEARRYARKHDLSLDDEDDQDDDRNLEEVLEDDEDDDEDEDEPPAPKRAKKPAAKLPADPAPGGEDQSYFRKRR